MAAFGGGFCCRMVHPGVKPMSSGRLRWFASGQEALNLSITNAAKISVSAARQSVSGNIPHRRRKETAAPNKTSGYRGMIT